MPLLLNLERVTEGGGANHNEEDYYCTYYQSGLIPHHIKDWFMAFGVDGAHVLWGKKNGVTNKLQVSHAPHMHFVHIEATL